MAAMLEKVKMGEAEDKVLEEGKKKERKRQRNIS
jgi:hypothetical protein